ncbi:helix-turn-helix domain-containing protein [Kaistia sp. UC242_56]|uniref:helix-turn-helix domain-containing protein n=1 Tax=Kaistia sp. UC242_56 TaxID=3374625 RepID=UPI0037B39162
MALITEAEVAVILRCSRSKVKRLRLTGQLIYLVGRPVLVDEADLQAYMDEVKSRKAAQEPPKPVKIEPTPEQLHQEGLRQARIRAQTVWMRRKINSKGK